MNMVVGVHLYVRYVNMCFKLKNANDEGNTNDRLTRWHGWMYARKDGACPLVNHQAGLNTSTLLVHWCELFLEYSFFMITLSYEGPIISKTYQIDVCIWGYRTCANIFDIVYIAHRLQFEIYYTLMQVILRDIIIIIICEYSRTSQHKITISVIPRTAHRCERFTRKIRKSHQSICRVLIKREK